MKAMKLTAVVVGIGLMLCGCGNDASSSAEHQGVLQYVSQDGGWRVVGPVWDCSKQIDGKWYYPVASIGFPVGYVIFLLIQAIILKFDSSILIPTTTTPLIYPYFFVNLDTQGVSGVLMWIGILAAAFAAVGFAFFGFDRLAKKKNGK